MITPDFKKYASLIYLGVCGILTLLIVAFSFYLYFSWDKPVEQDPEVLEIRLPVMNWTQYSTLSKRYENGIVKDEIDESDEIEKIGGIKTGGIEN